MTEKLQEWQEQFRIKADLLSGDFDAIELALFEMPNIARAMLHLNLHIVHSSWLKAAIQAGWIESPPCKALIDKKNQQAAYMYDGVDVDSLHPAKVDWLGKQIVERHDSILAEDPKN